MYVILLIYQGLSEREDVESNGGTGRTCSQEWTGVEPGYSGSSVWHDLGYDSLVQAGSYRGWL